jgi:hypothetical protein
MGVDWGRFQAERRRFHMKSSKISGRKGGSHSGNSKWGMLDENACTV